jgi:hypothetical protein
VVVTPKYDDPLAPPPRLAESAAAKVFILLLLRRETVLEEQPLARALSVGYINLHCSSSIYMLSARLVLSSSARLEELRV